MEDQTKQVMQTFVKAFQDKNPELLKEIIAENVVMESMQPAPNGTRYEGAEKNMEFWKKMITDPDGTFEPEDLIITGDRAINLWRYHFGENQKESVRGVTLFKIVDGKIVEVLAYAKIPEIATLGQ